ncbi:GAF domain-containing protein [Sediminitomix flava]|uniref:GAF domain-containing protein n=1 Tax=Sediminitomix flava TaxID=379075 RepID=A0A315Z7K7_SEDFL|nr:GAF domain-containing protein [Sediminitomix flava]PWJ40134.1 GAF domain-containing protein [Sediminitomix flava]
MLKSIEIQNQQKSFSRGEQYLGAFIFLLCLISNLSVILQPNFEKFYFLNFLSIVLLIPAWILLKSEEKLRLSLTLIAYFNFVIFSISIQNIFASLFLYFIIQTSLLLQKEKKNQVLFLFISFIYWTIQFAYISPNLLNELYNIQVWDLDGGLLYLIIFLIYTHLGLCFTFKYSNIQFEKKQIDTSIDNSTPLKTTTNSNLDKGNKNQNLFELNEGVNRLYDILINTIDKAEIYDYVTKEIGEFISAHRVAIYLVENFESKQFKLMSVFGESIDNYNLEEVNGLINEIGKLRKPTLIQNIPENYNSIYSSLGESKPNHIWVIPLVLKNKTIGILEVSSLSAPQKENELYLKKVSKNLTTALTSLLSFKKSQQLFEETKRLKDQVESKENAILKHMSALDTANSKVDFLKQEIDETLNSELNFFDTLDVPIIALMEDSTISRINNRAQELLKIQDEKHEQLDTILEVSFEELSDLDQLNINVKGQELLLSTRLQQINSITPRAQYFLYLQNESKTKEFKNNIELLEEIIKNKDLQIERQKQTLLNQMETTLFLKEKVDKLELSN